MLVCAAITGFVTAGGFLQSAEAVEFTIVRGSVKPEELEAMGHPIVGLLISKYLSEQLLTEEEAQKYFSESVSRFNEALDPRMNTKIVLESVKLVSSSQLERVFAVRARLENRDCPEASQKEEVWITELADPTLLEKLGVRIESMNSNLTGIRVSREYLDENQIYYSPKKTKRVYPLHKITLPVCS